MNKRAPKRLPRRRWRIGARKGVQVLVLVPVPVEVEVEDLERRYRVRCAKLLSRRAPVPDLHTGSCVVALMISAGSFWTSKAATSALELPLMLWTCMLPWTHSTSGKRIEKDFYMCMAVVE
jgi:hypothetical protein